MDAVFSPAAHAFRLDMRVYYADTDAIGIVYHANFLVFMERARAEWLRTMGIDTSTVGPLFGVAFVVRSLTLDFVAPARLDDLLTVTAEVKSVGRSRIDVAQSVLINQSTLVYGVISLVCVDANTGRPMETPARIRTLLESESNR